MNANSIKIIVAFFASYKLSDIRVCVTRSLYAHDDKTTEGMENNYIAALLYSSEPSMQSHQGALTSKANSTKQNDDDQGGAKLPVTKFRLLTCVCYREVAPQVHELWCMYPVMCRS